ncbi:hypothetical protein SLS59_005841 [Nothophoma quercina]|uniref:Uncharacterized protein n=1 Tax=Nothophoma quercina TaxID=749835 RepID=A0ABR3R787_9PLEO
MLPSSKFSSLSSKAPLSSIMAASRKVDPEKAAKYAIAASKGFSYYLPKSAQVHLKELLRQLPPAARSIYDEYYRDLMSAKACAPESAIAIANFVTKTFPVVAKKYNVFAKEMNDEIESNEHEGYVPVKFPLVDKPDVEADDNAVTSSRSKKRKRAPTEATTMKKAKTGPDGQSAGQVPAEAGTPPASSPSHAPDHEDSEPPEVESLGILTQNIPLDDTAPLTPTSAQIIEFDHNPPYEPVTQHSRSSSPLSNAPPSVDLSSQNLTEKTAAIGKLPTLIETNENRQLTEVSSHDTGLIGAKMPEVGLTSAPVVPSSQDHASDNLERCNIGSKGFEEQVEDDTNINSLSDHDYDLLTEAQCWQDGLNAIETFQWTDKGSCWKPGRGLLSLHHDQKLEKPAGLFRGNYWDDAGADGLLPKSEIDQTLLTTSLLTRRGYDTLTLDLSGMTSLDSSGE